MRTCSSLTLHEGTPLCGAVSCRFDGFWDHQSQLLMTSARSLEVSATGPSEIKSWTFWNPQLKSWSLMAPLTWPTLPAWNLTPFAVTDPSLTLVTILTRRLLRTDSQQAGGGGRWSELQEGASFGSYLCDAVSTKLIISLISRTRLPDGLERRSSSCLNWLQRWTWCCNYRGDWRQRLPLLIKDLTPASHNVVQWWEDSGSLPVSPIPLRPFQSLSVGSRGTQCGLYFFNSVSALLKLT